MTQTTLELEPIEAAHTAVLEAANRVSELRGELIRKQSLRNTARAKLADVVQEYQKSFATTPQQLLAQHCREQNALRAEAKLRNPEVFNRTRQTSAAFVRRNMRGYDGRRGGMDSTALTVKQIRETGEARPFSKHALQITQQERERGHVALPETKR